MTAALIYPTHNNIAEELKRYQTAGINAAAFPVRTFTDTDYQTQNCWNQEADKVERIGLPVAKKPFVGHALIVKPAFNKVICLR